MMGGSGEPGQKERSREGRGTGATDKGIER